MKQDCWPIGSSSSAQTRSLAIPSLATLFLFTALGGCEQRSPTQEASRIGETPSWGRDFTMQPPRDPGLQPGNAPITGSGNHPPTGQLAANGLPPHPIHRGPTSPAARSGADWSGGDANAGEREYTALCARCHGATGQGGDLPGMGQVPDLTTLETQARLTDGQIASVIAHGRGRMPAMAHQLDGTRLRALVAFVRSLKR